MLSLNLADHLSYWHFEQDLMVFKDGSLGAGYSVQGIDLCGKSDEEINQINQAIENFLSSIKENYRLEVKYSSRPRVQEKLKKHLELMDNDDKNYQKVLKFRKSRVEQDEKNLRYNVVGLHLFLRSTPHPFRNAKLFKPKEDFETITKAEFEQFKDNFLKECKRLESSLASLSLKFSALSQDDWFQLIAEHINPKRMQNGERVAYQPPTDEYALDLASQVTLTDLHLSRRIELDNMHISVISLKTLPEGMTYASLVKILLEANCHFDLSYKLASLDQKKEMGQLSLERKLAHSFSQTQNQVQDLESQAKLGETENLMKEVLQGEEKITKAELIIFVKDCDLKKLESKEEEILQHFKKISQAEGVIETLAHFDIFCSSAPGVINMHRAKKMKVSNAAHLCPLYQAWQGSKDNVCFLVNRSHNPFGLHPFDPKLANWNGIIFGGSGSGKSFTISQLMLMFYGQKPRPKIIWIDNGASSEKLLKVLDGEFLDLNLDSKFCINPFEPDDGMSISHSKTKLIMAVLETILSDNKKEGLSKREKSLLEELVLSLYQDQSRIPSMSDYKELLLASTDVKLKEFGRILNSWTGNSAFGKFLDGKTNVVLDKNLITVEIKGLDLYPELQNVMLLLFTDFIRKEASRDLSTPYLLIIDEAWKLFETPQGLSFTLEAFRTFRKYNGGIWCISQNYKDFLSNQEMKNAILPNTTSLFILRQKKIDWDDFQKTLDLNDNEIDAIKSLNIVKRKYSEVFYMQDESSSILRLAPDPLSYYICTSDSLDKEKINQTMKDHPYFSMMQALEHIAMNESVL